MKIYHCKKTCLFLNSLFKAFAVQALRRSLSCLGLKTARARGLGLGLLMGLCCSTQALAIAASSQPLPGSVIGVAYVGADNQIYGTRADEYFHPASTQKLITVLAAMLYLGPDYRLNTTLNLPVSKVQNSKIVLNEGGVLDGNVVIKFTGDPTLTTQGLKSLIKTLSDNGVKTATGTLFLDVSKFGGRSRGQGWSWNDLPVCFTAPSSAIILNRNCAYAELQTPAVGEWAAPVIASRTPIGISAEVMGVSARDYGGDCELETQLFIDNRYHLTGCVPVQDKGKNWPLTLAVSDPLRWGIDLTEQILSDLNLTFQGGIKIAYRPLDGYESVAKISSAPLKELVTYTLHKSNNLYADAIAKNIAYEYYNVPATYERAARAIRAILYQYANISLGDAYLVDGSGLSPHNLMTPRQLLNLLTYIKNNDDTLHLMECLPVSGESGTLHWRGSTINKPLAHNVIAKTGTLQNVSNLAGFVRTKSGQLSPFVIFTNAITYSQKIRDQVKYRRIASPHYAYERYLLENIYDEKAMGRDF